MWAIAHLPEKMRSQAKQQINSPKLNNLL